MLKPDGSLAFSGYSPRPLYTWNPKDANTCKLKSWDIYYVSTEDFHLTLALMDISYAGSAYLTYFSQNDGILTEEKTVYGPWHGVELSTFSTQGSASFQRDDWTFLFENTPSGKLLSASAPVFKVTPRQNFKATLKFEQPKKSEGLFVMAPLNADGSQFVISHKNGYEVSGEVSINGMNFKLKKEPGSMDWTRSSLPYAGGMLSASGSTSKGSALKGYLNL
jgi:hypothetical protein